MLNRRRVGGVLAALILCASFAFAIVLPRRGNEPTNMVRSPSSNGTSVEGNSAPTPSVTVSSPSVEPAVSVPSVEQQRAAVDYWTDERIANAVPAEAPPEASKGVEYPPSLDSDSGQADGPPVTGAPSVYDEAGRPVPLGDVPTGSESSTPITTAPSTSTAPSPADSSASPATPSVSIGG